MLAWIKKLFRDERGQSEYISFALAVPLMMMAVFAGLALHEVAASQGVLHNAAEIADRSIVANGCLTQSGAHAVSTFLSDNHMDPTLATLQASGGAGGRQSYGQSGLSVHLGYDLNLNMPGTKWTIWHTYVKSSVPLDMSQYVNGTKFASNCLGASTVSSMFQGSVGGQGSGGAGSGLTAPSDVGNKITLSVSPSSPIEGQATTVSGVLSNGAGPVSGASVTITGANAVANATTNGSGQYTATIVINESGTFTVSVASGTAAAQKQVTVQPSQPASMNVTAPSSVEVGQLYSISVSVMDQSGSPVPDGTVVKITSSNGNIASTQKTTSNGSVIFNEAGFTSIPSSSVSYTVTSGSVSQNKSITVTPGPPQNVTLNASPSTITDGQDVNLSGQVLGPDGTPVASGTSVLISSGNDAQDSFPVLKTGSGGNYSGTVALTQTGSITLTTQAGNVKSPAVVVSVNAGAPYKVTNTSATPDPVDKGANTFIGATVLDKYGNPVAQGTVISLTGSGLTQPASGSVGAGGSLSVPVSFKSSGNQVVTLAYNGTALNNGSVAVKVRNQSSYQIKGTVSKSPDPSGTPVTVTFTLTTAGGSPISGAPMSFTESPDGNGSMSAASGVTNASGQVSITVTPTTAGPAVVTAKSGSTTGTASWQVTAGKPSTGTFMGSLTFTPSVADVSGPPVHLTGNFYDQNGNPISGATVTVSGGWASGSWSATTSASGGFNISFPVSNIGGPYYPTVTVSDSQGSQTFSASYFRSKGGPSLLVIQETYTITVVPVSGGALTPAGTPWGVKAYLTAYGQTGHGAPVQGKALTFTVSGGDTSESSWSTGTPGWGGPTSVTVVTNSQGVAVANVAFEPYLGTSTIKVTGAGVSGTLNVNVTSNNSSYDTGYWVSPTIINAGQSFSWGTTLWDSSGFPVAAGERVYAQFENLTELEWTGNGGGVSGSFTPTIADNNPGYWLNVKIYQVNGVGTAYWSPEIQVRPAALYYVYPMLNSSSASGTTGGSGLSDGHAWTNGRSLSQGTTNWYYGQLPNPPAGGSYYTIGVIGYDQYGNVIHNLSASVSCSAQYSSCPYVPGSIGGSWVNTGGWHGGIYQLTLGPTYSGWPAGVSSSAKTTYLEFWLPKQIDNWQFPTGYQVSGKYCTTKSYYFSGQAHYYDFGQAVPGGWGFDKGTEYEFSWYFSGYGSYSEGQIYYGYQQNCDSPANYTQWNSAYYNYTYSQSYSGGSTNTQTTSYGELNGPTITVPKVPITITFMLNMSDGNHFKDTGMVINDTTQNTEIFFGTEPGSDTTIQGLPLIGGTNNNFSLQGIGGVTLGSYTTCCSMVGMKTYKVHITPGSSTIGYAVGSGSFNYIGSGAAPIQAGDKISFRFESNSGQCAQNYDSSGHLYPGSCTIGTAIENVPGSAEIQSVTVGLG